MSRTITFNNVEVELIQLETRGVWYVCAGQVHRALGYADASPSDYIKNVQTQTHGTKKMVSISDVKIAWGCATGVRADNLIGLLAIVDSKIGTKPDDTIIVDSFDISEGEMASAQHSICYFGKQIKDLESALSRHQDTVDLFKAQETVRRLTTKANNAKPAKGIDYDTAH